MKTRFLILLIGVSGLGGWLAHSLLKTPLSHPAGSEKRVLYYQSAMHPWVKSPRPGRCTICGMELTAVYEGEKGFEASAEVVPLRASQIPVVGVETVEAKVQPLTKTLRVAGSIDDDARRHRIISAYVDGRVDRLHANHHGIEVLAGQPMALISSPTLLQAEREYRQLQGELKQNAALRLQQMGLQAAQIDALAQKPSNALHSEILAPLSGTVVGHEIYEGQYISAGQKLFEIADFSTMWFMFQAYEPDLPWIEVGQTVEIATPSQPGKRFEGRIAFIDPNLNDATRAAQVRVELPNPVVNGRRELLHRLYAEGSVRVEIPATLAIPRSAVLDSGGGALVFVEQGGGAYARRSVKIGRRADMLLEVLQGLEAGERVVTQGNLLLDGQSEINRSFATPIEGVRVRTAPLSAVQRQKMEGFLQMSDAMAAALAADDLSAFHQASQWSMERTWELIQALSEGGTMSEPLQKLGKAAQFSQSVDLHQARLAFYRFTVAASGAMETLYAAPGAAEFQIWECAMVDQAIPDALKKARWIQINHRPGHNPFFGKEMLQCAKEIHPVPAP